MIKHDGLTSTEAKARLEEYGFNEIQDQNKISPLKILLRQISKNFIIYLLIFSAGLSFLLGKGFTAYVILFVILVVVVVGFIQEYKAERAIASLKKLITPVSLVRRDGKEVEVDSRELVPDDIVILRNGERIPADCLVLQENVLRINESILTGESKDISKKASPTDEPSDESMVYMGTFIVNGKCVVRVLHTGMTTRFGKIANMISHAEKELPLQNKINQISRYMVIVALVVSISTGLIMVFRAPELNQETLTNILLLVIALSVSAFPEGLPVVLVSALAGGASRLAKKNAVVSRMSIIETLGEATIICSDKTGTITKGEMTIKNVYANDTMYSVSGVGYETDGEFYLAEKKVDAASDQSLKLLLKAGVLCNDSHIQLGEEKYSYHVLGSATEGALLIAAAKAGIFKEDIQVHRVEEMPFDSNRKMMSVLVNDEDNISTVYIKGAPERVLGLCTKVHKGDHEIDLSKEIEQQILQKYSEFAGQAMRVLALGYKQVTGSSYTEDNFVLLGLVAMEDPAREEVKEAIVICKQAGISVKMITGDHIETAIAVGKSIGLQGEALEGVQIDTLSDKELQEIIPKIIIFARVQPEHKLRIVKALKKNGEIVAMTGDGVNDAPALKEAHIGVAMGINGTDVSRSVADITLKDDNFATIVNAVREGRGIFNNIRKFVSYDLSCNFAELSILFLGILLEPIIGWQSPILLAIQILFMNLVTDNLPAFTLAFNPISKDIMKREPRRSAGILSKDLIKLLLFNGTLMAIIVLGIFYFTYDVLDQPVDQARTASLVALIFLEIASAYNFRSFRFPVIGRGVMVNKYLFGASAASLLATWAIIYTPLQTAFEVTPIPLHNWLIAAVSGLVILIIFDFLKTFKVFHSLN
jgi:P-type Ca2+ transporter type 2C